jgi:hypothetical protein
MTVASCQVRYQSSHQLHSDPGSRSGMCNRAWGHVEWKAASITSGMANRAFQLRESE